MKYLVVTGGVVSGLGKGISISSFGVLLKAAGLRVTAIKIDPYLVRRPIARAARAGGAPLRAQRASPSLSSDARARTVG
jgi:hypothetical protein